MSRLIQAEDWFERRAAAGDHVGYQWTILLDGELISQRAVGMATRKSAMTDQTLGHLLCAGKPLIAALVARAWEHGLLNLDDEFGRFLPSLPNRYASVSIRQALTQSVIGHCEYDDHFEALSDSMSADDGLDCLSKGEGAECFEVRDSDWQYLSWPFVLVGAVCQEIFGDCLSDTIRREVFIPLGMQDSWLGLPADEADEYERKGLAANLFHHQPGSAMNEAEGDALSNLSRCVPAGGVRAPTSDIARFYEELRCTLLGSGSGWLKTQTVEALVARHRVGTRYEGGALIDFGVGFELESRHYGTKWMSYGPSCSLRTFGHKGHSAFLGFCDPTFGLVVAAFVNGQIEGMSHGRRMFGLARHLYSDLSIG